MKISKFLFIEFVVVAIITGGLIYFNSDISLRLISVIFLFIYFIFNIFYKNKIVITRLENQTIFLFIFILLIQLNFDYTKPWNFQIYSLNFIMSLSTYIFIKNSIHSESAEKILQWSLLVAILFSIFNILVNVYIENPFIYMENFFNYNGKLKEMSRVYLPFGTPNSLAFFYSMLLLSYRYINYSKIFLIIIPILILLTGSLSSILPLFIVLQIFLIQKTNFLTYFHSRHIKILFFLIFFIFIFLVSLSLFDINLVNRDIDNMINSIQRHYYLRSSIFYQNYDLVDLLIGRGIGQFSVYIGGSYSFSFILTMFFEAGFLGLIFVYIWYKNVYAIFGSDKIIFTYYFISSNLYHLQSDLIFFVIPALIYLSRKKYADY